MANLGVDGLRNMFALDDVCIYHILYKDNQLIMDHRGGLESARGLKLIKHCFLRQAGFRSVFHVNINSYFNRETNCGTL